VKVVSDSLGPKLEEAFVMPETLDERTIRLVMVQFTEVMTQEGVAVPSEGESHL
jgi:hypothetical protein